MNTGHVRCSSACVFIRVSVGRKKITQSHVTGTRLPFDDKKVGPREVKLQGQDLFFFIFF